MLSESLQRMVMAVLLAVLLASPRARAADCNGDGTPDELEPDCNSNGMPDECDISGRIFWVDNSSRNRVQRSSLTGSRVENLVLDQLSPRGIAVDAANGKVYWTDVAANVVRRANLDGTDVESLVTEANGVSSPRGIALDTAAGKMYWAEGSNRIVRANLDGTEVQPLFTSGLNVPFGIALDVAAGKMYWADSSSSFPNIRRANMDGTGTIENIVDDFVLFTPYFVALDIEAGKIYWTDPGGPRMRRANMDGSGNIETVVPTAALFQPTGIALDVEASKVYWADIGLNNQAIRRANLDGTQVDHLVVSVLGPYGVALALPVEDLDTNGIPDECEGGATLVAAYSSKPNAGGPGGYCDLPIDLAPGPPITTETRSGGISEVVFVYDGAPAAGLAVEADCTCPSPPAYEPIDPAVTCAPDADALICTFAPALPNACTYRFTVASGAGVAEVELRGLVGDVNSDGSVNALDRAVVIGVWTGANAGDPCQRTNINNDGGTNALDRAIVIGAWTGAQNCAP